ncbi:uncharacterized protein At3g06530 isoform X1 [Primulina tabacum]|uniref:uncharacterized protein At3g06530 isoform X1 n=1 Tax=Primulina tabacum TaxID=48773 RepID=UPI003F593EAF
MAGTSISSQLQAIKTILKVSTDPEPGRGRPITRPSILFDAKAAADIDLDAIFDIAISGLEVLISMEERFRKYRNDLFSHQSREFDRELVGVEENTRINASIYSYLQLLSGYLESYSALKTLEYLIRRYKIHVYNVEELILCALPYHDTHAFVQIMQLIDTGNSKWKFLDGVKVSGARLPRGVIVKQCIQDKGILEAICNNAATIKKREPSLQMTAFCTAVVFEVLGLAVTIDSDIVKRILMYVSSGLKPNARGLDQKAGALMIVTLLVQRASLEPNVVKSLMRSVADIARIDAKETANFQWLRMSLMALIKIVQLQNVELIPKKTLEVINDIRDISGILSGLNKEFNIDKFLAVLVESLLEYSPSDDLCRSTLLSIMETVPMEAYINRIISKVLTSIMNKSREKNLVSSESGLHGKRILVTLCEKYPNESRVAFYTFLKSRRVAPSHEILCQILGEDWKFSTEMPDPRIFFALEHVEAEIRRSAILGLDVVNILQDKAAGLKKFDAIQEAILHRLSDDDISVVLAALNLKNLSEIISLPLLIEALQSVLQRCIDILLSSSSTNPVLHEDAAISCLQQVITSFKDQEKYAMTLATMIFPLVLIRPKAQRLNLKALELVKEFKWPFYENLVNPSGPGKKFEFGHISAINMENICKLAETFSLSPDEYMPWLVKCCNSQESNALFFLVLLQTLKMLKMDHGQFPEFFDRCFPFLKSEWEKLESMGISAEQSKKRMLDCDCKRILEDLVDTNTKDLNVELLSCLFLGLLQAFNMAAPENLSLDVKGKFVCIVEDLFLFFTSHSNDVFKIHLEHLVKKCKIYPKEIILKFLTEEGVPYPVQVQSLRWFSHLSSQLDNGLGLQLLVEFPCILVPLSSDNKDVRMASMSCIEGLFEVCSHISKKAKEELGLHFLGELLLLIIQQKKMILSDKNVLASFFTSILSSSSRSLLLHPATGNRFNSSTKKEILDFILGHALKVSSQAKLKILRLLKGLGSKLMYVDGAKLFLNDLLENHHRFIQNDGLYHKLSKNEIEMLCILLEGCVRSTSSEVQDFGDSIAKALQLNGAEDSMVVEPCLTVLSNLSSSVYECMKTETQELIFRNLLILLRNTNCDIHNATRETLLRINVSCSVVGRVLASILDQKGCSIGSAQGKKRRKSVKRQTHIYNGAPQDRENTLSFMSSFLDVLLMKKNIENRTSLVGPLFELLRLIFVNDDWTLKVADQDKASTFSSGAPQTVSDTIAYIQQTLLITLEDICASLINDIPLKEFDSNVDLQLLVNCARCSSDAVTRNHVFLLITTLAKIVPDRVLHQILDILTAIGESTVIQCDSYSQSVFEGLISAVVPCWLSRTDNTDDLLQIFVNLLPQVAESRRLSIILHILSTLGEAGSLGSLLFLLFRSIISRKSLYSLDADEISLRSMTIFIIKQWEYGFALQLCQQYSCTVWLPSINLTLQKIRSNDLNEITFMETLVAIQFVAEKLRDPEMSYRLDTGEDVDKIQNVFGQLMEQVVFHLQLVDFKYKHVDVPAVIMKELKQYIHTILKTVTKGLLPSTYFNVIIKLIGHADDNVKKKALGLLSGTVKEFDVHATLEKKGLISGYRNLWIHLNEVSLKSFENLCLELLNLLDASDDVSSTSLKLAAVSTLEVLASRLTSHDSVFTTCLGSVCKRIRVDNSSLSCHCLRAAGALISALGPKALPELPGIMDSMLMKSSDVYSVTAENKAIIYGATGSSNSVDFLMSILLTLEAVINNLGGFLNPYLVDILKLVMLHPLSLSISELKLKSKANTVRKLITDKIPVRLLLPPLLSMYYDAVKSGESSLSVLFEMLGNLVNSMNKSSIGAYHAKIFDLCLLALDLRRQSPASIIEIDVVEQNAINAVVALTMKLTETMFRPLFIRTVEWSGSNMVDSENVQERTTSRAVSFYGLVNKLAESHRSLFVPYFKYLLDGCVQHLADSEDVKTGPTKKKKAKLSCDKKDVDRASYLQLWHLRALILSSLHKCFLYDTGNTKFLDSSNFQVLLKPIVIQLTMDPPVENHICTPSVKEVDDLLVACVGQMAVAAGSDLLWKPLNHEVLMQTRSEKVRARILGLRIVKYIVEKLKEEYLVFLPETIPFLGELLEDVELPVKSLAQEILREMETMSGESLKEYL